WTKGRRTTVTRRGSSRTGVVHVRAGTTRAQCPEVRWRAAESMSPGTGVHHGTWVPRCAPGGADVLRVTDAEGVRRSRVATATVGLPAPRPKEPGPPAILSSHGRSIASRREKDSVTSHETPRPIGINLPSHAQDPDPEETREWLDSFDGLVEHRGADRASEIVQSVIQRAREEDIH